MMFTSKLPSLFKGDTVCLQTGVCRMLFQTGSGRGDASMPRAGWFKKTIAGLSLGAALLMTPLAAEAGETRSADATSQAMVDNLAALQFDKLGYPQIQFDSINSISAGPDRPHRLLVLPIRFSDKAFDRFEGEAEQDLLNQAYFQNLLFAGGVTSPEAGTLSHYYRHQSRGMYNITGDVFATVELEKPQGYYGAPSQNSDGSWRSDQRSQELVRDALSAAVAAQPDFAWADYDIWDPTDYDGDGNRDEPDGYLDHLVMVVSGGAQSSCHGLYKLDEKLTPNSSPDAVSSLTEDEQACANRMWPHRSIVAKNLGKGPVVDGTLSARSGIDIGNGLWVVDYNLQSEYTDISTFIHEFGHSLGLPDIYARLTSNSTGSWEVMSSTVGGIPQEMSTWSRTVLGWMKPCIVKPLGYGGDANGSLNLKTMNDWSGDRDNPVSSEACDSAMVILPPKRRSITLGPLIEGNGNQAVYSGQGNEMLRHLSREFDLSDIPAGAPAILSFDTWFEIESEWDYLYIEAAAEDGVFKRILPIDKSAIDDTNSIMPAAKGHEGPGSVPGFTGLSGDRDGDGKSELAPGCDPSATRTMAEDQVGSDAADPCDVALWINAEFDLSDYAGGVVEIRFTYFTDVAAVENGALIDNVRIDSIGFKDDFEAADLSGWQAEGFTLSGGYHELAVPHYYLLEYRDPYAEFDAVKNYDAGLGGTGFVFAPDGEGGFEAINTNYRSGVLVWYYNGEYLWSQNEPAEFGAGNGFLLVVDSTPQEFELPQVPSRYYRQEDGWSWYEFGDDAQAWLRDSYIEVMCFQLQPGFYSADVSQAARDSCQNGGARAKPRMEGLRWKNRSLMYGYTIVNTMLPGSDRLAFKGAGTLFDLRIRNGEPQFRLYDRILRNWHAADAPFAIEPFEDGFEVYKAVDGEMRRVSTTPFAPVHSFTDATPNRYLNPRLPFGGANIPDEGFAFSLSQPDAEAPAGTSVQVDFTFSVD